MATRALRNLQRELITEAELMSQLHQHGVDHVAVVSWGTWGRSVSLPWDALRRGARLTGMTQATSRSVKRSN
jgi:hypothetical protein